MRVNRAIVDTAKNLLENSMGIKGDEKLLVVADKNTFEIGYNFALAGREYGVETTFIEAPVQKKGEPPEAVAAAMAVADVQFLITTMSYSHVKARIRATENGARIASMPMMTKEIAEKYLDADYSFIEDVSHKLSRMMTEAETIRISTEKGTNLTISVKGRQGQADTGVLKEAGLIGNLPAGEAYIAPIETIGSGKLVIDGCIAYVGPVKDDVILTLRDGIISKIEGGESARNLEEFLKDKDQGARGISEFGIGTNPAAKIIGHPLLDEKVWGTIHIAFGMNLSFGGKRDSNIHYDCIINKPSVWIDDKKVMDKGKHL